MATRIPRAKAGAPAPEPDAPDESAAPPVAAAPRRRPAARAAGAAGAPSREGRPVRARSDAPLGEAAPAGESDDDYADDGSAGPAATQADYAEPEAAGETDNDGEYDEESAPTAPVRSMRPSARPGPRPARADVAASAPPGTARRAGPPSNGRPGEPGPRQGQPRPGGPRPPQAGQRPAPPRPGGQQPGPAPVSVTVNEAAPTSKVKDFPAGTVKEKELKAEKPPKEKKERRSVQTVMTAGLKDVLNKVGAVAQLIGVLCAAVLVVYVLLVASDANANNSIYRWFMHRSNNDLVYGFRTLFNPKTPKAKIVENYLVAAAAYLVAGAVIRRLLKR